MTSWRRLRGQYISCEPLTPPLHPFLHCALLSPTCP